MLTAFGAVSCGTSSVGSRGGKILVNMLCVLPSVQQVEEIGGTTFRGSLSGGFLSNLFC